MFNYLFERCRPKLLLSHRVESIDYVGDMIKVFVNNSVFFCRRVISSIPLGLMLGERVKFVPDLPVEYKAALKGIGNGVANKLFVSFERPFWGRRSGWLNFVTKNRNNKYPVAMILQEKSRNILCVFVSGGASMEIGEWTDKAIVDDFLQFLGRFIKDEIKIRAIKVTRWHLDDHSLGSYSYCRVGEDNKNHAGLLRKAIDNKLWLVG